MIRRADVFDAFRASKLAKEFHEELYVKPFNQTRFVYDWQAMASSPNIGLFVAEKGLELIGAIGVLCQEQITGAGVAAVELFWYVTKKHRGGSAAHRLLKAAEEFALQFGCDNIKMACMESLNPESVESYLLKSGYKLSERYYEKKLNSTR